MLRKKSSSTEKKRKHSQSEERHDNNKRRSTESNLEDSKDDLADPELDRIGSDIEDGGLDLSLPFQPITAYVTDKREMLEQCFHVLGDKKLRKMLPDELKQEQVLLGLLVNGVGMLGGEEVAVNLRVQEPNVSGPGPAPRGLRCPPEAPFRKLISTYFCPVPAGSINNHLHATLRPLSHKRLQHREW